MSEVGRRSPDGMWWWDGTRWLPTALPPQAASTAEPSVRQRSWLAFAGGILALAALVTLLVACILPYGSYSDGNGGTASSSIFNGGYAGAGWQIPEPAFVIVAGLAAAILVMAVTNRTVRGVAAGAILALGFQTVTMWIAYFGSALVGGQVGPGSFVGIAGGALLFTAGILALASVFVRPGPA